MSISGASYTCLAIRGLFGTGAFLFIPLFLSIFFVYATSRFIRPKATAASRQIEFLGYACSVFGTCIGLIMGASKGPIASASIPAFVTLLAGLIAYFFSRETLRSYLPGLPTVVGALGFSVAFGIFYAASSARSIYEAVEIDQAVHKRDVEKYIDTRFEFLAKAIKDGYFDQELFQSLFRSTSTADFRLTPRECQYSLI